MAGRIAARPEGARTSDVSGRSATSSGATGRQTASEPGAPELPGFFSSRFSKLLLQPPGSVLNAEVTSDALSGAARGARDGRHGRCALRLCAADAFAAGTPATNGARGASSAEPPAAKGVIGDATRSNLSYESR
jgi:hypothetical protein